jgi:hypothetical protein
LSKLAKFTNYASPTRHTKFTNYATCHQDFLFTQVFSNIENLERANV